MILSFTPRLAIIPAYVEINQCTYRDVISRALRYALASVGQYSYIASQLTISKKSTIQLNITIFDNRRNHIIHT